MMLPLLSLLAASIASIGPSFVFDPSQDPAQQVSGNGTIADWSFFGDARTASGSFETTKGGLTVPGYTQPDGPFSVEVVFRPDSYGDPAMDLHISDLANTATWVIRNNVKPVQGFTFRTGGGRWYPQLGAGAAINEWSRRLSLDYFDVSLSAKLSRCLLDFTMAPTNQSVWFEVFSDRCVELGKWHHAVATWDGKNQRIFLDGEDVTDPWRVHLPADVPRLDANVALTIGARAQDSLDYRYLRGGINVVSIVPRSMTSEEVVSKYHSANLQPAPTTCTPRYRITSPLSFQVVSLQDTLRIRKSGGTMCSADFDTAWASGDSVDLEVLDTNAFSLGSMRMRTATATLDRIPGISSYTGPLQFRLRPAATAVSGAAARAAATVPWSNGAPAVLIANSAGIRRQDHSWPLRQVSRCRYLLGTTSAIKVTRLDGREASAAISMTNIGTLVDLSGCGRGTFVAKSKTGSAILLNP